MNAAFIVAIVDQPPDHLEPGDFTTVESTSPKEAVLVALELRLKYNKPTQAVKLHAYAAPAKIRRHPNGIPIMVDAFTLALDPEHVK